MPLVTADPNLLNAPPGWAVVDALLGSFTLPARLGFTGTAGDINRFWSRYRLAKSFRGITIDVFVPDTVQGYSALFRVFLVWSAFEHFMRITGNNFASMAGRLAPYDPSTLDLCIRQVDDYDRFLHAVHAELDRKPHKHNLGEFLAGRPCNILIVPCAIRHIFAHGKLTPNTGVGHVAAACGVSQIVCQFLFEVMDGEFLDTLRNNGVKV
jgi:hypothetical protein